MSHGAQDSAQFYFSLDFLAKHFNDNWNELENLYLFFTELWHQNFKTYNNYEILKKSTDNVLKYDSIITKNKINKTIYTNSKIKINKLDNIYNSVILNVKFEPYSEYVLKIKSAKCIEGDASHFTVGIKDNQRAFVISKNNLPFGENIELQFITLADVDKYDLKLYAGVIENTTNISVEFNDVELIKLNEIKRSE